MCATSHGKAFTRESRVVIVNGRVFYSFSVRLIYFVFPVQTTTRVLLSFRSVRLAHNHDGPFNQRLEHLPFTVFIKPCSATTAISPSLILCVTNLTRLDGNVNVWHVHLYRQSRQNQSMTTRAVKTGKELRSLGHIPRRDVPSRKRRMHVD